MTSSPTSTSSSTSERAARAGPGIAARAAGLVRLVHPFPSLLTSSATGGIAALAGGEPATVIRLFLAMLGIQVSIGALNDVMDAVPDGVAKPRKPIPAGVLDSRVGLAVAGGGAILGLGLSAVSGPSTLLVALAGLALGWIYDLRLSRTALSWLPLALALPLLPIHAWLGATGTLPAGLPGLVPIGVLGGAGLALANGIVDIDRDAGDRRSAGVVRLGRGRAWLLQTALLVLAAALAVVMAPVRPAAGVGAVSGGAQGGLPVEALVAVRDWGLLAGCGALALGASTLASAHAALRERGWELEAIGVAALGVGWLAGVATLRGG